MAAALRELETAGMVNRTGDPVDRRKVRVVRGEGPGRSSRREGDSWLGRRFRWKHGISRLGNETATGRTAERLRLPPVSTGALRGAVEDVRG